MREQLTSKCLVQAGSEKSTPLAHASWRARWVKSADVYDNFCDSANDSQRAKVAGKARRAIRCAGDAPELRSAVAIVRELIADYPLVGEVESS